MEERSISGGIEFAIGLSAAGLGLGAQVVGVLMFTKVGRAA